MIRDTSPSPSPDRLTADFPLEYLEAVAELSLAIEYGHRKDTLIAVNPRGIVAIIDTQANQATLVPLDHLWKALGDAPKAAIENWLAAPDGPFYIIQFVGSWFNNPRP